MRLFLAFSFLMLSSAGQAGSLYNEINEDLHSYLVALADHSELQQKVGGSSSAGKNGIVRRIVKKISPKSYKVAVNARSQALQSIYRMLEEGETEDAAISLFELSQSSGSKSEKLHAKYLLGQVLMNLGFDEAAAYQFVAIIKAGSSPFVGGALEFLTVAASNLGDDSKINYAVSRLKDSTTVSNRKDILHFRKGELDMRKGDFDRAARRFSRVPSSSPFYLRAKYNEALSHARGKKESNALRAVDKLLQLVNDRPVTDSTRVTAQLAKARILYQKKDWDKTIEAYRQIPRDSFFWHDTLFEQSWAYLMAAKFRSALSNFHSLHSPYYDKYFLPESLVLRAIVYLYICNYDEVDKVVKLFERLYTPLEAKLKRYLSKKISFRDYFSDFNAYVDHFLVIQSGGEDSYKGSIPEPIARQLMKDGEMRKLFVYLQTVKAESMRLEDQSSRFRSSSLGTYLNQLHDRRGQKIESMVGRRVKELIVELRKSLLGFMEQNGLLKYELINQQKANLKKRMAGEEVSTKPRTIDSDEKRDFYIQNGFNYWPFRGEYWLDEIGNYQYLGVQSCGK